MTVIELAMILFVVGGAVAGAILGGKYGVVAGILGLFVGAVIGVITVVGLFSGIVLLAKIGEWWRPAYPACKNGRCGSDDYSYSWDSMTDQERALEKTWAGLIVTCECGDRYLLRRTQRRLMEVDDDGQAIPYRAHQKWGRRWVADHAAP